MYVACESGAMRRIRTHLLTEKNMNREHVVTRGYWKLGEVDHPDGDGCRRLSSAARRGGDCRRADPLAEGRCAVGKAGDEGVSASAGEDGVRLVEDPPRGADRGRHVALAFGPMAIL